MVTLQAKPAPSGREKPASEGPGGGARSGGVALAVALLLLSAYAVFAHGAIDAPGEPRLQVATALLAAIVAAAFLWGGTLRLSVSGKALIGLAAFVLFALWSGLSLIWSVAPDLTWLELNRNLTYVIALGLGLVLGASLRHGLDLAVRGFLVLGALVTVYALGQKLAPGLHISSVVSLNQTGRIARLQEPLGYWNGLALLLAMVAPAALASALRRDRSDRERLIWLVLLELIFVTIGFTYSRGGLFVLVVALLVCVILGGDPLRALACLAAAALAALPSIVLGLTSNALTANGVSLSRRGSAGILLLLVVLSCSAVLWVAGERLLRAERTASVSDQVRARMVRLLAYAGGLAVTIGFVALALSFSHLWSSFTSTGGISVSNPARLLSADSANRWVWWKEAAGAFSSRPVVGWGAGSFPVVHLMFRQDTLTVQHPHSMPLQWLAETGIVGLLLIGSAWILLLWSALGAVRGQIDRAGRLTAAAVFAALVAYTIHCLFDWDWDIPGLTFPLFAMWGVLVGSVRSRRPLGRLDLASTVSRFTPGVRLVAIAFSTLGLCLFALSCVLPSLSASYADSALLSASRSSLRSLEQAQREAASAASLDPLSDAGPRAEAVIAEHRADLPLARAYLLEAVRREPADVRAWADLSGLDAVTGHTVEALSAARHVLQLDPQNPLMRGLALRAIHYALLVPAPPVDSATRSPTP